MSTSTGMQFGSDLLREPVLPASLAEGGPFRLRLPGRLAERPRAIEFVVRVCRALAVPLDAEHAVIAAFGEAFNQVALESYGKRGGDVTIEVEVRRDRITVRLRDRGAGFDPRLTLARPSDGLPDTSFGLFIMMRAMDDMRWSREGGENVVTLIKQLYDSHTT